MEIPLRERNFDFVLFELVPDDQEDLALDIGHAILRVVDPDTQFKVDGTVAKGGCRWAT